MSFWCKLLGHRWDACHCVRCGAGRDQAHRFEMLEGLCAHKCAICEKQEEIPHQWNHCACSHCGEVRDEDHDWIELTECEQICRLCGKERAKHQWRPMKRGVDRCRRCGKVHKLTAKEIARRDEKWANEQG